MIGELPGDKHWQMLAKAAMHDDLSGLQRTIASEVLTGGGDVAARDPLLAVWQERNRRAIERVQQLMARAARGAGRGRRDALGRAARAAHARVTVPW